MQRKAAAPSAAAENTAQPSAHADQERAFYMDAAHRGLTALTTPAGIAVQARGNIAGDDAAEVHQAAAAGVSGSGGALPHLDRLEASFGAEHDLTQVSAHVGGQAAAASEQMGAQHADGRVFMQENQPRANCERPQRFDAPYPDTPTITLSGAVVDEIVALVRSKRFFDLSAGHRPPQRVFDGAHARSPAGPGRKPRHGPGQRVSVRVVPDHALLHAPAAAHVHGR